MEAFAEAYQAFGEASRAAGVVERSYTIGSWHIRLRFAGSALVPRITPAFAHLPPGKHAEPALTVCLWDAASTATRFPPLPTANGDGSVHRRYLYRTTRQIGCVQPAEGAISLLDPGASLALYWVADAEGLPSYERAAPLRLILHWWMGGRGRPLVHAGAVGVAGRGVLLAGRGGSGKSTAALGCLQAGLSYAGDDYVLVQVDPSPFVHSLYSSGKVEASHARTLAASAPADEKVVLFLHEVYPERMSPGFSIEAVLLPRITGRPGVRITPVPPVAVLAALAPTTIFQLPGAGQDTFDAIARLVRRVPGYVLEMGPDIAAIPPVISRLLAVS